MNGPPSQPRRHRRRQHPYNMKLLANPRNLRCIPPCIAFIVGSNPQGSRLVASSPPDGPRCLIVFSQEISEDSLCSDFA